MCKKIIWVCGSGEQALRRKRQFNNPPNIHFVGIGGPLMGRVCDEIILDYVAGGHITWGDARVDDWVREAVQCRLTPTGIMKKLTLSHLE